MNPVSTIARSQAAKTTSKVMVLLFLLNSIGAAAMGLNPAMVGSADSSEAPVNCHQTLMAEEESGNDSTIEVGCCVQCLGSIPLLYANPLSDFPAVNVYPALRVSLVQGHIVPLYKPPRD